MTEEISNPEEPKEDVFDSLMEKHLLKEEKKVAPEEVKEEKIAAVSSNEEETEAKEDYAKLYAKLKEEAALDSKFSREKSLKIKKIASEIKRVVEAGLLDDEEGNNILAIIDQKDFGQEEEQQELPSDPLLKKLSIVPKSLVDSYLDFSDTSEEEYTRKLKGFSFLLHEMAPSEREAMEDEMDSLSQKPVNLLKFVLKKGEEFLKESAYEDFLSNGGFRNLKKKHQERIAELEKKLEKAQKELSSYKSEGTGKFKIKESNPGMKVVQAGDIFDSFKDRSI